MTSTPGHAAVDLVALGWDAERQTAWTATLARRRAACALAVGRVARATPAGAWAMTEAGAVEASLSGGALAALAADPASGPAPGDWVVVRSWPDGRHTLEKVLPRRTAIRAPHRRGGRLDPDHGGVLAANVDLTVLAAPLTTGLDLDRLTGLVELATASGTRPVVALTKADLAGPDVAATRRAVAAAMPAAGVVAVSARTGAGVAELAGLLGPGRTCALIGVAGAGRPTLVAALCLDAPAPAGPVAGASSLPGMLAVRGGGVLLDAPGLRALGRWASFGKVTGGGEQADSLGVAGRRALASVGRQAAHARARHRPSPAS